MRILSVFGILIILAVSAFMLREMGYRGVAVFLLFGVSVVLSFLPEYIDAIFPFLSSFFTDEVNGAASAIMKISGIGILAEICAEICDSLGEKILSRAMAVILRLEVLIVVIPYFEEALTALGGAV